MKQKRKRSTDSRVLASTELVHVAGGVTITDGRVIGVRVTSPDTISPE